MKPALLLTVIFVMLASCKPQKPWSPSDKGADPASPTPAAAAAAAKPSVDIGDLEQAVYVSAKIADESRQPGVTVSDLLDRNKYVTRSTVVVGQPRPASLWAEYTVTSTRTFPDAPGVLRARVMIGDKVAGNVSAILGSDAKRKGGVTVKVDLLKPFEGNVPDSFLAKVEGDLYLLPAGTDEKTVDPETATSDSHSRAVYATIFRVDFVQPTASAEGTGPVQTAPPAPETAAPAPAP